MYSSIITVLLITLSFIPVKDANNLKVGYRYLTEDSAKVQTYVFNYLHGLALDKYLYTRLVRILSFV